MSEMTFECRWVSELLEYVKQEWPDFKPDKYRLEHAKELIKCGCDDRPPMLVCSNETGDCRIQDGRHRIIGANELGREKLLVRVAWK